MLLGHRPKSRLHLLKPMTAKRIEATQWKQKKQHDVKSNDHTFNKGDFVFVKNFQSGDKWLPGIISQRTGPVSFMVQLSDGRERCCHQDQLQKQTVDVTVPEPIETETLAPRANTTEQSSSDPETSSTMPNNPQQILTGSDPPPRKTYPTRNRTAVQRHEPMW